MRGVILCGGTGSRLLPLTSTNNKHLLHIYNKPMCYYPIETLVKAGIKEIALIVSGNHAGKFIELLQNGEEFGLNKITYLFQKKQNGGIADALMLAEDFADKENITVILGDNTTDACIKNEINNFKHGAHLFLKEVSDPFRFGVPTFKNNQIVEINEKPKFPASNYAVTGLYIYDSQVFEFIKRCSPSERGELEITSVNNFYINEGKNLSYSMLDGFWQDAGTIDNLYLANKYWYEKGRNEK